MGINHSQCSARYKRQEVFRRTYYLLFFEHYAVNLSVDHTTSICIHRRFASFFICLQASTLNASALQLWNDFFGKKSDQIQVASERRELLVYASMQCTGLQSDIQVCLGSIFCQPSFSWKSMIVNRIIKYM